MTDEALPSVSPATPAAPVPPPAPPAKAPITAMWICMILAWLFFILPIPFTVILAAPLNLAAFILAIVCLVRSRVLHGVLGLAGTTIVSTVIYFIGLGSMAVVAASGIQHEQEKQMAAATKQVRAATDVPAVDAAALLRDYEANEVAADNKYKGKIVQVTGVIDSIGKDIMGSPQVILRTGGASLRSVQFMFDKSQEAALARLAKGKPVTIRGKVDGMMINVVIRGSQIVE